MPHAQPALGMLLCASAPRAPHLFCVAMSSLLRTGLSLVCRPLVASCLPLLWATTLASMPTKAAATDLAPLATQPMPTPGYVQQLQQQARASHLAQAPAWRQLLHYARQPLSGRDDKQRRRQACSSPS